MSPRTDLPSPAAVRGDRPSRAGARAPGRRRWSSGFLARCAPALAAGVLLATLAAYQADRATAAETAFLALWATAALLPASALAPPPGWEALLGAPLAVLAAWALPAGPARLAAVAALLVGVLAVAGGRALSRAVPRDRRFGALGITGWPATFDLPRIDASGKGGGAAAPARLASSFVALALGAQVLLRSELLLAPDLRSVIELILPPLVAAWALGRLAVLVGAPPALIAGALAATLGPGFSIETTLPLLGVAAGAAIGARLAGRDAPLPVAFGTFLAAGLLFETRAAAAALAAAGILVLTALATRRGGRSAANRDGGDPGAATGPSGASSWPLAAALAVAIALPVAALAVALRPLPEALALLAWVPLLLPVSPLALELRSGRFAVVLAALGLALAAALALPGSAALVAALAVLAVLALAPPGEGASRSLDLDPADPGFLRSLSVGQATWSVALLAATALLAAPPWLRPLPAVEGLALFGPEPTWRWAILVAALASAAAWRRWPVRGPARRAAGLLALGLAIHLAVPGRPLLEGPAVVLRPDRPRMALEVASGPVATVAVYSHLSNGLELPAGTEVATVALLDAEGRTVARWPLRAGVDTGEWAVRRPDVAAHAGIASPPPWAAWISGSEGDGEAAAPPFFGQYYRALLELEAPVIAARLTVERSAELPAEVQVTVHRVEVTG